MFDVQTNVMKLWLFMPFEIRCFTTNKSHGQMILFLIVFAIRYPFPDKVTYVMFIRIICENLLSDFELKLIL